MEDELQEYEEEISVLRAQLEACQNETERNDLVEVLNELTQLVDLMKQRNGLEEQALAEEESLAEEQEPIEREDVCGLKCHAPYPRFSLPLTLHAAVVLEDVPRTSADQAVMVRVLYSNPMLTAMCPCDHFLKGNCRFGDDNCKFSHGEVVPFDDLETYMEPDFASLTIGSLVLTETSNRLWELARVAAHDGDELAVKLLKSGTEVAASIERVLPIDAEVEEVVTSSDAIDVPASDSFSELKGTAYGRVTNAQLGDWQGGGFGLKIMQKMGYKLGQGLGKRADGIVHAIQAKVYKPNTSLDHCSEKVKVVDGVAGPSKPNVPKSKGFDSDIFRFINNRLNGVLGNGQPAEGTSAIKLDNKSTRDLGALTVDLDSELKKLKSKKKSLLEGIARNKNDRRTVDKMQNAVSEIERKIAKLEGDSRRVNSEMSDRRKKQKDIF